MPEVGNVGLTAGVLTDRVFVVMTNEAIVRCKKGLDDAVMESYFPCHFCVCYTICYTTVIHDFLMVFRCFWHFEFEYNKKKLFKPLKNTKIQVFFN